MTDMPTPNNQLDKTDEYIEFLAGRHDKEPQLDPADEDISKATRLLGTLRERDPRPVFVPKIKHAILATSQHLPVAPPPPVHRFTALVLWQVATPILAVILVLATLVVSQWGTTDNHAGTNFKKTPVVVEAPAVVELAATNEDALGVDAATSFTLTAKSGTVALADVEKNFTLQPAAQFTVTPTSPNTFTIIPKSPLVAGHVYAATYQSAATEVDGQVVQPRAYSWAYQVRNQFGIIGLLPRDKATGVSLNSGIEVTFSSTGVTADEFKKNFTIEPAADGRVEIHHRTLVFIPTKPLTEKTIYTVTVKKGLKADQAATGLIGDEVWQFETSAKNSKDSPVFSTSFFPIKAFESIQPNEPVIFSNPSYEGATKPKTTQFTIYQYPTLTAFIQAVSAKEAGRVQWSSWGSRGSLYPTDGLKKVGVYKTTSDGFTITLGPGWPAGFYLIDGGNDADQIQLPLVVSNVGAYSMVSRTDALVWVNDLTTKTPIAGATLTVPGVTETIKTDAQGIARFSTPIALVTGSTQSLVAILKNGSQETPVLLNGGSFYVSSAFSNTAAADYWAYLSTDRSLYQPNDTIQFWGLLRHRDQPRTSTTIVARIVQQSYEGRYEPQVLATATLTANSTGTFLGSLKLDGASPNTSTFLEIQVDGQTILSRYLTIETYRKPPYKIMIEPDHLAAIAGDKIKYTITTQFFDGTPVPNLPLKEAYSNDTKAVVTTNAQGKATYSRTMTEQNGFLSLAPTDAQADGVIGSSYVQVFPSALEMSIDTTLADATGTLTGTVNKLLPENVDPDASDPLAGIHGPAQADQSVSGQLIEMVYDKVQSGTHYDYLLKESVPDYQYTTRDVVQETFSLTTDSQGALSKTFTLKVDSVYRVELTALDSKQRTVKATGYFWRSLYNNNFSGSQYSLTNADEQYGGAQPTYAIGGQVTLEVRNNGTLATVPANGKILYLFNQRGLRRYDLSTSPTEKFTFGESDVPSVATRAVIFTGAGYAEMTGPTVAFEKKGRALTIAVSADKPVYGPGDQVRLTVKATDPNGRGQAAHINLKAIDEAFLALDQVATTTDDPSSIYNMLDDGVLGTYVSHEAVTSRDLAEGGGGGGDRADFKDTAVFTEITTDAQGNGALTFTLPDNLTSWRVTAQGFTDGLLAGKSQTSLTVSKDIFVTVGLEPDQLSRDKTTVIAATYGRGLTADDGVAYTFSLADIANSETTLNAKAFSSVRFSMPALSPGTYKVRVEAKAKNSNDVVILPVTVSASRLERQITHSIMLPSDVPPTYGQAGRTLFSFDDADRNLAYTTLWDIFGGGYNRLDDVVAAQIAQRELRETFNETIGGEMPDPTIFLTGQGAALYVIGSPNLETGALAAGDPSLMSGRQELLTWFERVLDDPNQNTEQIAQALYGLAQLGQPVLPDIRAVLALPDLADADRLTLLLALETLGAKEEARPGALALLQKYGESQDRYFRLNLGESDDEKIVASGRFAILAAGLGLDQRYGLLLYLQQYRPRDTRTTLEQALATSRLLDTTPPTEASVTYEVDGQSTTAKLSAIKPVVLNLTATQAKTLKITATTGQVSLVSAYQEPFDIIQADRDSRLSLNRTYLVNNKKTTTFTTGDLVKVQLTWTKKSAALGTFFGVTDILPTGLRPVSNPWMYDRNSKLTAPYAIAGQRVQLYAGSNGTSFYYLARASAPGQSVAEPAILQAFDAPSSIQYSNEAVIEIK